MKKFLSAILSLVFVCLLISPINAIAEKEENAYNLEQKTVKKDNDGYDVEKTSKENDLHYGWELGKFKVTGYTDMRKASDGTTVFLKNVGDQVALSFVLEQDISALNGDENVFVNEDKKGFDTLFGIPKSKMTNFGKGALIIKKTDYQNQATYFAPYVDYLKGVKKGANTKVSLFEEGDYEVALDYEIRKNNISVGNVKTAPTYSHYQVLAKFSVRNGNCMVYPFDVETKSELINASCTENGFYLDLAKSRYLQINVKKLNYAENDGELIEDIRFNKPASDGEEFTDEGVYIITAKNIYTEAQTEKKIYVGSNPILKAYVTTGKDIEYIKQMVNEGATINDDGTIVPAEYEAPETTTVVEKTTTSANKDISNEKTSGGKIALIVAIVIAILVFAYYLFTTIKKKKDVPEDLEYNSISDEKEKVEEDKSNKENENSEENKNDEEMPEDNDEENVTIESVDNQTSDS